MFNPTDYFLSVLKTETDRDKQVKVGASNLSNMCVRCLADDFLGVPRGSNVYWLGAKIGTALHEYVERNAPDEVLSELRVSLGVIPGYGEVKSTTDLYVPSARMTVDLKTTTRSKLKALKRVLLLDGQDSDSLYKANTYFNQLMLYGSGVKALGHSVEKVAVTFVCRDGTGDNDIWSHVIDFDEERANLVWERGVTLYKELQEGLDPDTLEGHIGCWVCNTQRRQ